VRALHLRPELRLQGRLRLQPGGAPLTTACKPGPEPAPGSGPTPGKDFVMRMFFIMGSSLVLTLGLRLIDPPAASAAPLCSQAVTSR
jgi:hypothetical protein